MTPASLRISGFLLSPSLFSLKLDRRLRISFLLYTIFACSFEFSSTKASPDWNLKTVVAPKSVPVRVAYELLLAGHRYVDVRTPEEFNAGHPPGAINIPYMYRVGSGSVAKVATLFKGRSLPRVFSQRRYDSMSISLLKSRHVLEKMGCKGGGRSIKAATNLVAAGFSAITNVAGGFDAWV